MFIDVLLFYIAQPVTRHVLVALDLAVISALNANPATAVVILITVLVRTSIVCFLYIFTLSLDYFTLLFRLLRPL